jgi:hypothetical protein
MTTLQEYIDQQLKLLAPVDGVSFGNLDDKATWRISFNPAATPAQQAAAQAWLDAFNPQDYIAATDYINKRIAEYPALQDQLDYMYNYGFDGWKQMIQVIKDKYPKPEGQ